MAPARLLTDEWLEECNAALAACGPAAGELVLTEHVTGATPPQHGAVTLVADATGVRLQPGIDERATATLTISLGDAEALQAGTLGPAEALAQGRVRVRGDLRAVVEGMDLLARAHRALRDRRGA